MDNWIKTYFPKQIIWIASLAIILAVLRIVLFGNYSLVYMFWNIFLAVLPFLISVFLLKGAREMKLTKPFFIIGGIIWILFLPNAPYLVTDLIHIGVIRAVPVLYDAFFLFTSAWLGILLFLYSIFHFEQILRMKYLVKTTNIIIVVILFLTSFGIYLGRFLRFNSWDVFINHFQIIKSSWQLLSETASNIEAYLYIVLFFAFLSVSYFSWKSTNINSL